MTLKTQIEDEDQQLTKLAARPDRTARLTLEELLVGVTDENRHPEIDFGPPVGKERFWEDDPPADSQTPSQETPGNE